MKKLLSAVLALLCLAACNSTPGPEHTTPAEFGEVTYFPTEVTSETPVTVEVPVTSQYGFSRVDIVYMLDDDYSDVRAVSPRVFPSAEITSFTYNGTISNKKLAGKKVTFQVRAITFHNVPSYSQPRSYTVPAEEEGGEKPE